jgi:hypothetical protein
VALCSPVPRYRLPLPTLLAMLSDLERELGSRRHVAGLLTVNCRSVDRWRRGEANPDGPSSRLIWLYWLLMFHPERIRSLGDLLTWGLAGRTRARKDGPCRWPGWDFEI